jgi:hypothetical protein
MIIAPEGYESYLYSFSVTTLQGYRLDDSNDAIGYVYSLPKDGTITHLGIYMTAKNGTVPDYNIGLVILDSSGNPTTTAYGSSASQTISPSTMDVGWHWIELSTPATDTLGGDNVAIHIWPSGTPPTSSNFAEFAWDDLYTAATPVHKRFTTSWSDGAGIASSALQYSDSTIVGYPVTALIYDTIDSTTDDEWGVYFELPFSAKCNGVSVSFYTDFNDTETFNCILYDSSNTELVSRVITDIDHVGGGTYRMYLRWSDITINANTPYRLVIKATGSYLFGWGYTMQDSTYVSQFIPECTFYLTKRSNSGSWTDENTKVPYIGILISEITAEGAAPSEGGGDTGFVW